MPTVMQFGGQCRGLGHWRSNALISVVFEDSWLDECFNGLREAMTQLLLSTFFTDQRRKYCVPIPLRTQQKCSNK
eukprot:6064250-Amphidinium_carterae.1